MSAKDEEFFKQLTEFSARFLRSLKLPESCPWGGTKWSGDAPKGAVIHFTADEDAERVLRWFMVEKLGAKASAHVVVADRRLGSAERFLDGLPLVADLPVTVVQCRPPQLTAWHATWTNDDCYGIENVNAGELRKQPAGSFTSWRPAREGGPEWSAVWNVPYKKPVELWGKWWEPYTADQVKANIMVLRYVNGLFGRTFQKPWILGHEQVQGHDTLRANGEPMHTDKRDPGPTYPLSFVRAAVTGPDDLFLTKFREGPGTFMDERRDVVLYELMDALANKSLNPRPSREIAWARFTSAIRALPTKPTEFGVVGKAALRLLGYHVSDPTTDVLDTDDFSSVWLFQKLMGLKADSHPGADTKAAIVKRLVDRGLIAA